MPEPMAPRLRPLRAGLWFAVLFGLAHIAGHFTFFGAEQPRADLAAGRTAMLAATIETAGLATNRWQLFLFFSLALSVGTVGFGWLGLATLRAAQDLPAVARTIGRVGLMFGLALLGIGAAHAVLQPIIAGAGVALCCALSLRR